MTENPYQVLNVNDQQSRCDVSGSSKPLWIAYTISPIVAPISFIAILFLLGAISTAFGVEVNPASFLVLPLAALTLGTLVSYVVAGVIGMPIAFYLRNRNSLTGFSIHVAATCWAVFFSVVVSTPLAIAQGAHWHQVPLAILTLACAVSPPVLLSATCFWLIVRKFGGLSIAKAK